MPRAVIYAKYDCFFLDHGNLLEQQASRLSVVSHQLGVFLGKIEEMKRRKLRAAWHHSLEHCAQAAAGNAVTRLLWYISSLIFYIK